MDKESKKSSFDSMPDNEKLCFDSSKSTSNVVEFEPNLLRHARIHFGSIADQVLEVKVVPNSWTVPYAKPAPTGERYTPLEIAEITEDSKESKSLIKSWSDAKPRFTSFLELCIHPTGITRIKSMKDVEWKTAIKNMDVLAVHKLMIELHTFVKGGAGFQDDDATQKEHSNFNRLGGENLVSYIQRYTRMKEKLITVGATGITDKKYMYRFLEGLKTYDKSLAVQNKVVEYLALVETNNFPLNLATVQSELTALDRVQNVVQPSQPKGGNPFATVNVTDASFVPKPRMFADKSVGYQEPDGSYRIYTMNGISKKLKFEPGKGTTIDNQTADKKKGKGKKKKKDEGGNSDTPNSDRYFRSQAKKTGKSEAEVRKDTQCNNCFEYHECIAKDCKRPKKPAPAVNTTHANLKVGWNESEEVIETPEHLKGFFSVLAIDANPIEPSYLSDAPKKKKKKKPKKKVKTAELDWEEVPIVDTPSWLKNLGAPTMCMAHGMSKVATEEELELEESRRLKNYNSVNIDDHANIHLFANKSLLTNLRKLKDPIRVVGMGGMSKFIEYIGEHPLLGDVLYDPNNGYNIMSMDLLEELGYIDRKSEDRKTLYLYHKENKSVIAFKKDPFDRFWKCPVEEFDRELIRSFPIVAQLHREYFAYPMSAYYTVEQQRRAQEAIQLHQALDHPSDRSLTALLQSNSMINVPITAQDLANARAIYGPCPHCLEGKPKPHVGSHKTFDPGGAPTKPGQLLHADIVWINGKPRMFVVDNVTGYCDLLMMKSKSQGECCDAFESVIHKYKSNLKVVRMISCDSERSLIACETFLNGLGVKLALRIPYEHEKIAERHIRILRERMETKLKELPYRLPADLYDALASECVRTMNLVPNGKSMPHTPQELVTEEKFNYLTDFVVPFGMPVLCDTHTGKKQYNGTSSPQEIGFCLGPAANVKGGCWVYFKGRQEALVRRGLQPCPMTQDLIDFMNHWHDSKPEEGVMLKFTETFEYSEDGLDKRVPDEFDRFQKENAEKTTVDPAVAPKLDGPRVPAPFSTPSKSGRSEVSNSLQSDTNPLQSDTNWLQSDTNQVQSDTNSLHTDTPIADPIRFGANVATPVANPIPTPVKPANRQVVQPSPAPEADRWASVKARDRKPNSKYVASISRVYSIAAYLTDRYKHIGDSYSINADPGVFAGAGNMSATEALKSDHAEEAKEAISKEFRQLIKIKAWKYLRNVSQASPSVHKKITPCSMFVKKKKDGDSNFLIWKARLVGGGHRTDPTAYEPFETHSPTVPLEVAMMQLGVASYEKANVETFDIPCAYLNATLAPDRQQLMRFPKHLAAILAEIDPDAKRHLQPDGTILVQVLRALYGFPESAKLWNEYMTAALKNAGYTQSKSEACLFRKVIRANGSEKKEWSTITLYVDDCLHVYNSERMKRDLYARLRDANLPTPTVQVLNLANSISYLGMVITMKGPGWLFVAQPGYTKEILEEFKPKRSYPTPCDPNIFKRPEAELQGEPVDMTQYLSKLMKLMFLGTRTRPDLLPTLSALSTKARGPNVYDMARLDRVIGYLSDTVDLGINIRVKEMKLYGYCDASWACHQDLKGHTGIIATMGYNGFPIYCKSQKQKVVTRSSTEAELVALFTGVDYMLYLRRLFGFMGYNSEEPITILQDNTSTITMAYMGKTGSGSNYKYMDLKYFWIKDYLDNRIFELKYLQTDAMLADFMASPRVGSVFRLMRNTLLGYER